MNSALISVLLASAVINVSSVCFGATAQDERNAQEKAGATDDDVREAKDSLRILQYGVTLSAGFAYYFTDGVAFDGEDSERNSSGFFGGVAALPAYWFSNHDNASYCARRATVSDDATEFLRLRAKSEDCIWHWWGLFIGTSFDATTTYFLADAAPDEKYCPRRAEGSNYAECRVGRVMLGLIAAPNALIGFHFGITELEHPKDSTATLYLGISGNADLITKAFIR